ncbi:MAG: redoxin domain-containing protein [Planctomycetes bacterium]|nr:redoxin domain-containing protein [Planctomycetota bacterium]
MRRNRIAVLCLGLTIILVTGLARVRSTSGKSAQSEQAKQITCTGKVVDDQNLPIAGAKVILHEMVYGQTAYSYDTKQTEEVTTRADGAFSFSTSAESDVYRYGYIVAQKEGLALGFDNWSMREGDKELEIKLGQPEELSGIVVDEKNVPVADAKVSVSILILGEGKGRKNLSEFVVMELLTKNTDEAGKFAFTDIPAGATAEFIVKKAGRATVSTYKRTGVAYQKLSFAEGQTDIKLVLPIEAKIEGIIVQKSTGKPIGGVQLRARTEQGIPFLIQEPLVSKQDGTFSITALAADRYLLELVPPREALADWISEPVEVITEVGKTKSEVKIDLSKGGILEVKVKDAVNKKPLEKTTVSIQHPASSRVFSDRSDKDGIARIRLRSGEYQMGYVFKEGYSRLSQQETITIEDGKTAHIEYQLAGQTKVTGVIRNEKGNPVQNVKLKVCPMSRQNVSSDADGKFELTYDPGSWSNRGKIPTMFLIGRYEENNLAAAVQLDEDDRVLDITLKPGIIFTGKVLDPDSKGIANARINTMLRNSGWNSTIAPREPAITDKKGNFEIRAIPVEHKYNLYTTAEGYGKNQSEEINTKNVVNNRLDVGTITLLLANLSISGLVVDANNNPVAGVKVSCFGDNQPRRNTQTDTYGKFTLEKVCAGNMRISVNKSGTQRLYGRVNTEGGATDVKILVSQRGSTGRYVPNRLPSLVGRYLPDLKALKVELSPDDTDDKMILVCFWDMQQRPSRNCIMQLAKQAEQLKQKGITVIAAQASKIDENKLNEWIKKYNIPFNVGTTQDDIEKTRFIWGVRSLPWLILTNRQHVVSAEGFSINELDERIATLREK